MAREPVLVPRDVDAITTFVFQVRNLPGALYKALGGFATNGVNMQKLESYMLDGSFTSTQFYCDVAGHPEHSAVAKALEELRFFSRSVRILGVYPADPIRDRRLTGPARPGFGRVTGLRTASPTRNRNSHSIHFLFANIHLIVTVGVRVHLIGVNA